MEHMREMADNYSKLDCCEWLTKKKIITIKGGGVYFAVMAGVFGKNLWCL